MISLPRSVEHWGAFEGGEGNADVVYSASLWLGCEMISEDFSRFLVVFFDLRQEDPSERQLMSSSTSVRWLLQGVLNEGQRKGGSCGLFRFQPHR